MAKHTIDIINSDNSTLKMFSIEDDISEQVTFSTDGLYPCIELSKDILNKYKEQNKLYYIHTYGDIYNLIDDVNMTVIAYNKEDEQYHVGIVNMINKKHIESSDYIKFIDLTKRIKSDVEYWIPKYCCYNYEKFHTYQTSLLYLFDTMKESQVDMLNDIIQRYKFKMSKEKATVITLNNKELYQQKFDKIFNERVTELKEEITDQLQDELSKAESNIKSLTNKITYVQEDLNKVENGTDNV